jgi:PEGA domain-containing protein
MKISTRLVATVLASMAIAVTPAFAQHRGSGGHSKSGGHQGSGQAAPRSESHDESSGGHAVAQSRGAVVRGSAVGRTGPVAVARPYYYARTAPIRFYRPYYAFRPHFNLGLGLFVGYPIAYSAGFYSPYYYAPYYDPYYYGSPYPYYPPGAPTPGYPAPAPYPPGAYPPSNAPSSQDPGYSPSGAGSYPPGAGSIDVQTDMGGLSFEITPSTAQIYIDGTYMGTVGQFTPQSQPLGVKAGHHQIEIRADGFRTMQFDADIIAGQVLPYQGDMER